MYGFRLPEDFLIGTANSAFQSEGAWDRDGKTPSIMDHFAEKYAGKYAPAIERKIKAGRIKSGRVEKNSEELPDKGCFFYDNYEAYIEDMAKTGQNVYRLSLSWPRILPEGTGPVNPKGIEFYNKVIDKLLEKGITPFVDLYHWDLPMALFEQDGFLNPQFPEWFENYARVCFEAFGDRVKLWSTFNESHVSIYAGYHGGDFPPFIQDKKLSLLAGHYTLLAHFRAVRLYKSMNLGGKIGAVNCIQAIHPAWMKEDDIDAVHTQYENTFGWWLEPMLEGTYPQKLLREIPYVHDNMPENYQEDLDKWFIPMDFAGLNYYTAQRTEKDPAMKMGTRAVEPFFAAPGQQYTPYPAGLFDALMYVHQRYHGVEIYITENGCALPNINDPEKECEDPERITYLREHLRMVCRLLKCGVKVKGYMYWNDADSYEIQDGHRLRFGLTWVDHATGERRWKASRHYFSEICKTKLVN